MCVLSFAISVGSNLKHPIIRNQTQMFAFFFLHTCMLFRFFPAASFFFPYDGLTGKFSQIPAHFHHFTGQFNEVSIGSL